DRFDFELSFLQIRFNITRWAKSNEEIDLLVGRASKPDIKSQLRRKPSMLKPVLSADSHVTEPPDAYVSRIDRRFKDRAPHMQHDSQRGDIYVIDGINRPISVTLLSAAGVDPVAIANLERINRGWLQRGGWDPAVRLADQDRDGIGAEILYPS